MVSVMNSTLTLQAPPEEPCRQDARLVLALADLLVLRDSLVPGAGQIALVSGR